jgi:hypothetical protein
MQPDLFAFAPQGKVVRMRNFTAAPPAQHARHALPPPVASEDSASDPLYARGKSAPRHRFSSSQSEFNFEPPTHRPFSNELKPVNGLAAAPLSVRFYSLLIDALVVLVLSIMFAVAVFVAFRASGESLSLEDLYAMPWYLPVAIPISLSLGYKASVWTSSAWTAIARPSASAWSGSSPAG